ncbi:arsinothricin resistance N-acetyltransferase ArsN1 family B [Deltaproteobacteria bacterium TL4]
MIRTAVASDAKGICDIYNFHVENTIITFEETPVREEEMAERIKTVTARFPWLVYLENEKVLGYAYANQWRPRSAYKHTVESTIYLSQEVSGKGLGKKLYQQLLQLLQAAGYHAVIACIALPNQTSITFNEKFGFTKIAHFREVGLKFGKWVDTGYWELLFDHPTS